MSGLYTEYELNKIRTARVAISGVGGAIGSYLLDLLLRKGFENFVLSDPDIYEIRNISRQLFANCRTVSKKKINIAIDHIASINPKAHYETIECVNATTVRQFVLGADVVSHQAEGFSSWLVTLDACAKHNVPFVNAARRGNARTMIATRVYDFRATKTEFDLESIDFDSFGIPSKLSKKIVTMYKKKDIDLRLLSEADRIHNNYKKDKRFLNLKHMYPEVGSIEEQYPKDYYKRYTEPEICLLAAALAGRAITDIVIGRKTNVMEIDIFSRK
jgi:molybdopterin/thiamine biosynthesis adenylyltransferase